MVERNRPVAMVTGAARRIGAVIARTLHAAGYDLALHGWRSRDELDSLAAELQARRADSTLVLVADLGDPGCLPELVAATADRFGRLDALVNNASLFHPTPLDGTTAAQWDALFAVNARAPWLLAQAAAPHLSAARGSIVNVTDIYAERPLPRHSAYCMSKAALRMATSALAEELGPGVRVNAVAPGAILWPEGDAGADRAQTLARIPLARTGTPEEVAGAVLWLIQGATYMTGQTLRVDGGRLLGP